MLECKNLGIQFGGLKAVDNFNLNIEKGMLYGLIGPNGAGKTTVFNLLTGVYKPSGGTIRLNGNLINGKTPTQINNLGIARTFQNIRLFSNMSVLDNVKVALHEKVKYPLITSMTHMFGFSKKEKEMDDLAMEILEVFSLGEKRGILSGNLPYGDQRKLARALATSPSLLLLDEPAAGMNPNETEELMDTIRKIRDMYDMTILLIEHDMKLVAGICEKLTVLNFGTELASGIPSEVLNNPEVITAYLGE